jgi:hypothetical protein
MVVNTIAAQFQFKNGLIIKHVDEFDLYKWSKQAFGLQVFTWMDRIFQKKIQQQAQESFVNTSLNNQRIIFLIY